jgi:hypothetical protein
MGAEQRQAEQRKLMEQGFELRAWWLREMSLGPSPLTERMTLFWHNHFATSQQKVRAGQMMKRQNALLRSEALGNLGRLLHEGEKDPALLIYLDNAGSLPPGPRTRISRARGDGAPFTPRRGHYSSTRHQGSGARVHRLEPSIATRGEIHLSAAWRYGREDRPRHTRRLTATT